MGTFTTTFSGAAGTNLDGYTESGITWDQHTSYATNELVISDAGRARSNSTSNTSILDYADWVPATEDYDVEAILVKKTDAGQFGICARVDSAADTFYVARYNNSTSRWELYKFVTGTPTQIGGAGYAQALTANTDYSFKLEVRGTATTTVKLYVHDGSSYVERVSYTDNSSPITAKGLVGIRGANGSNSAGYHIAQITATDVGGGGSAMLLQMMQQHGGFR